MTSPSEDSMGAMLTLIHCMIWPLTLITFYILTFDPQVMPVTWHLPARMVWVPYCVWREPSETRDWSLKTYPTSTLMQRPHPQVSCCISVIKIGCCILMYEYDTNGGSPAKLNSRNLCSSVQFCTNPVISLGFVPGKTKLDNKSDYGQVHMRKCNSVTTDLWR